MYDRSALALITTLFTGMLGSGCVTDSSPHVGDSPAFPLTGAHAGVPCSSCHGDSDPPQKLPADCTSCHANDVPDADHFVGQDCSVCHTADGWDAGVTATTDTAAR